MIKRVKIDKLFGYLNHDFEVKGSIGIIFGKNGTGKTTVLRIINSILSGKFSYLRKIKFQTITLEFNDGTILIVQKANKNKTPASKMDQFDKPYIALTMTKDGKEYKTEYLFYDIEKIQNRALLNFIDRECKELQRINYNEWLNTNSSEIYDIIDIVEIYGFDDENYGTNIFKSTIKKIIQETYNIKLIETQRLLSYKKADRVSAFRDNYLTYEDTISRYSKELSNMIIKSESKVLTVSQTLDSTFPRRLLNKDNQEDFDEGKIINLANDLKEKKLRLEKLGIITSVEILNIEKGSMNKFEMKAIYLSLNDSLDKYEEFNDLEKKLSMFLRIVKGKFSNKTISISRENGLEIKTFNGDLIMPNMLSSGEQHEIVLLYDLIFNSKPNSIILIDEPEISLHIDWQLDFINDLIEISEFSNPQFLIATHSPSIVGNRNKITKRLEG